MIEFKNISKRFGNLHVLKELDLSISMDGIFAILGPNGSGKTTLIKCLLGMVQPNSGSISLNSQSILGKWEYRNELNYLPQIANFPGNLTVFELIEMVKNLRPKLANEKGLIELFGLQQSLHKKLGNLSGGTKQKVNLVLTFMFDSNLIILDEPTTGLDPIALIHLKELIKQEKAKGKAILLTTHSISFVTQMADEIVFLLDGKIYFKGTIEALKLQTNHSDLENGIADLLATHYV